jgi:hypothetical protein
VSAAFVRRPGRPPLAAGKVRSAVFTLRLSAAERAAIIVAAARAGIPVTQWARDVLVTAARKSLAG